MIPSQDEIAHMYGHLDVVQQALHGLTGKKGDLTKDAVVQAAGKALSDPDLSPDAAASFSKEAVQLISAIPDDATSAQIRQMLGGVLLHTAENKAALAAMYPRAPKA